MLVASRYSNSMSFPSSMRCISGVTPSNGLISPTDERSRITNGLQPLRHYANRLITQIACAHHRCCVLRGAAIVLFCRQQSRGRNTHITWSGSSSAHQFRCLRSAKCALHNARYVRLSARCHQMSHHLDDNFALLLYHQNIQTDRSPPVRA